ncbi:hypothetical protein LY78DRAFT_728770 [Colletotrichum sublineola]|nr:hypothetical protein LY78DRAFT_728770 [Colletotrichum sublineola]
MTQTYDTFYTTLKSTSLTATPAATYGSTASPSTYPKVGPSKELSRTILLSSLPIGLARAAMMMTGCPRPSFGLKATSSHSKHRQRAIHRPNCVRIFSKFGNIATFSPGVWHTVIIQA